MSDIECRYCGGVMRLTDSAVMYGKSHGLVYLCENWPDCMNLIPRKGSGGSQGILDRDALSQARIEAHRLLDRFWEPGTDGRHLLSRRETYSMAAKLMGWDEERMHIGMMDQAECKELIRKLEGCTLTFTLIRRRNNSRITFIREVMSNIELANTDLQLETLEQVLVEGDLAKLTINDRLKYYNALCESLGLNPLTRPFRYIELNGKLTLYATKDCTDQLRKNRKLSIELTGKQEEQGVYIVTARARDNEGRTDESTGAVNISGFKGEARANAMMKAETKAKRRVTLSIGGLGWLDETETDTIPGAEKVDHEVVEAQVVQDEPEPHDPLQEFKETPRPWPPELVRKYAEYKTKGEKVPPREQDKLDATNAMGSIGIEESGLLLDYLFGWDTLDSPFATKKACRFLKEWIGKEPDIAAHEAGEILDALSVKEAA